VLSLNDGDDDGDDAVAVAVADDTADELGVFASYDDDDDDDEDHHDIEPKYNNFKQFQIESFITIIIHETGYEPMLSTTCSSSRICHIWSRRCNAQSQDPSY